MIQFFKNIWYAQRNRRELEDMAYRFSCVLCTATGGRMSNTNYSEAAMKAELDAYYDRIWNTAQNSIVR